MNNCGDLGLCVNSLTALGVCEKRVLVFNKHLYQANPWEPDFSRLSVIDLDLNHCPLRVLLHEKLIYLLSIGGYYCNS